MSMIEETVRLEGFHFLGSGVYLHYGFGMYGMLNPYANFW